MIVSLTPLGASPTIVAPISSLVAQMAQDVAALKASFSARTLIAAPVSPIVTPGLYLIARPNLTIALGTPASWRCGLVQIRDYSGASSPNITIAGTVNGGSGAALDTPGETLTLSWLPDDQTWVTT